jgi:hypothetical protein
MAVEEILRVYGVIRKDALGGFEHGPIATGFGQCGGGVFGQDMSEVHQARVCGG